MYGTNDKNVFTSGIQNFKDLAKNFLFQVVFEFDSTSKLSKMFDAEDLMLRARSITTPSKKTNKLTTHYMGSKKNYPGKTEVDGDVTIKFDEFQDMLLGKAFYDWQNLIYSHGVPNATNADSTQIAGGSLDNYLNAYTATIYIYLYDSTLKYKLPYYYTLYEVFPINSEGINLASTEEGKIEPSITFNYNTFDIRETGNI